MSLFIAPGHSPLGRILCAHNIIKHARLLSSQVHTSESLVLGLPILLCSSTVYFRNSICNSLGAQFTLKWEQRGAYALPEIWEADGWWTRRMVHWRIRGTVRTMHYDMYKSTDQVSLICHSPFISRLVIAQISVNGRTSSKRNEY